MRRGRYARLYASIVTDDKVGDLLDARKYAAIALYQLALAWCAGNLSDGHVPRSVLGLLRMKPADAHELVKVGLWEPSGTGWQVRNYLEAQESRADMEKASRKGAEAIHRRHVKEGIRCRCGPEITSDRPPIRSIGG